MIFLYFIRWVSTHSRAEAAAYIKRYNANTFFVSTHSRAEAAAHVDEDVSYA